MENRQDRGHDQCLHLQSVNITVYLITVPVTQVI